MKKKLVFAEKKTSTYFFDIIRVLISGHREPFPMIICGHREPSQMISDKILTQ